MKNFQFVLLNLLGLVLFSCQHDDDSVPKIVTESLTKNSSLTSLLARVSQNPTVLDNIIDGTSFCSVKLPVTVYVDYQKIEIKSKEDFSFVATIMDESIYDDDKIHFEYPITMMYRNFNQFQVNSEEQLNTIVENYGEYEDFPEIDCIDFNYPIVINTYDSNSQVANLLTVQSNAQLFNLIANLKETDIFSLVFPISMTSNIGNQTTIINNNTELNTAIAHVIDLCDLPVSIGSNLELSTVITNGTWHVSYFLDETEEKTSQFYDYNFTFYPNGTVVTEKNSTAINGTWSSYTDEGIKKINLNFDGTALEELEKDWELVQINGTNVRFSHGSKKEHYLYFTKN